MKDLITVVIPAYNAAAFIERAVDSVKAQSYQNWELVIVENGSEDDTAKVCEKLCRENRDGRLRLFHSEKGVSRARNAGMAQAKGEWLCFLDADDVLTEDALCAYAKAIDTVGDLYGTVPDIVFARHCDGRTDGSCVNGGKADDGKAGCQYLSGAEQIDDYIAACLCNPTKQCTTHVELFRKAFLVSKGVLFREELTHGEDSVFLMELMANAPRVAVTDSKVYRAVANPNSAVRAAGAGFVEAYKVSVAAVTHILQGRSPKIDNGLRIYTMSQLLIIFVHDTFTGKGRTGRERARRLLDEEPFASAIRQADLSGVKGLKRLVFGMMKRKNVFGIYVAVKIRQRQ